ncbi:MAG: ABC transporter permease [Actinomycetota bacterium]|nr:ABC transporter permease [Actinomycetota bacterium]
MGRYLARRLLIAIPTLLGLSLLIFVLVSAAPGDPAEELARRVHSGNEPTPAQIDEARRELNLDRPFFTQYGLWLKGAVSGDLGESFYKKRPVADEIRDRVPATVELAVSAFLFVVVMAVPLGVAAAMFHRHWVDHGLRFLALVFASVPGFFMAYLLIIFFATKLQLFPVAGRQGIESLVLPSLALAALPTAVISRLLRSSLLEVFTEDHMRTARSKGLRPSQVVVRHGLRNAAIPMVTYMGVVIAELLEGAVVVEVIFAWPGMGQLTFEAISQRDYPTIQAVVLFSGAVFLVMNLLVDMSYRLLDPRIRLEAAT